MSDAVRIAEASYVAGFGHFTSRLGRGVAEDRAGVLHLHSGALYAGMNPSILHDPSGDAGALFDDAAAFHAQHVSPAWCLTARKSDEERIGKAAETRGYTAPHDMPFMVLDAIGGAARPVGLTIDKAIGLDGIILHFRILAEAFASEFRMVEPVCDPGLIDPRIALFVGRLDGEPVACAVALLTDEPERCVGVFNIGTLPAHRGKGIGRAMTAHAAAHGRDAWGCRVAALQASEAGYPLYRAMGYREVTRWQAWTPPGPG